MRLQSRVTRRMGILSGAWLAGLGLVYAVTLAAGLATIASPEEPISGWIFTALEGLILLMVPGMIALAAAVHDRAPAGAKALAVASGGCMVVTAAITACVHVLVLTLSRREGFEAMPWPQILAFRWPSLVYALDILAWDVFFALSMFFAAPIFAGSRLADAIRRLLFAAGAFALAGLAGVFMDDMQVRNIGIIGYGVLFPIAAGLVAVLFGRDRPED